MGSGSPTNTGVSLLASVSTEASRFSGAEGAELACPGARPSEGTTELPSPIGRVLHLINGEHFSGAERVQDLLSARLPEFGFQVGLACVKPGRFAASRQHRTAPLFETPMHSKFDLSVEALSVCLMLLIAA